ncbi:uncharacterized protein LOC127243833 [Andrographis paniculata]|uniref:uncharacterized protein LOC127243833 n=1 Tax=Andrographis paniculata TaxID=175694 RepID=UPI0021E9A6F3|nr:uncharacterized protein LOC127243833 [Andrographis paniculata]XP_051119985.1 uncharacterized protein LOC127243833 [Andrographis paniculata]
MDGNTRFELSSASPDSNFAGNYQNGQRGYSAPTLGRSSSFREGSESRSAGSGKVNSRVSASLPKDGSMLSQYLMLEPIVMGDTKYARGDFRRVLSLSEENSFGAAHLKSSPPMVVEELKRLRANVADVCAKASGRAKKLDEHLNKLNKFVEAMPTKKQQQQQQQRNDMLTNDRPSGSTLKIGSQHRNPSELGSQKFDDRPKSAGLNKRLRTSVAETRAECRTNGALRQPLMVTKERELVKENNADSDAVDEKIRRLPPGGEGWEKKMKRKRSVGAVFLRSADNDGEVKRNVHPKLTVESSLQSSDSTHGFRSGASGGNNKLDPLPSPAGSSGRMNLKNEQEKPVLSREISGGPIKERALGKVNVKLNNREENHSVGPSPIVKGKASRAPRSGSMAAANAVGNSPQIPGTLESWDQPQGMNRTPAVSGLNNRKRPLPAGSSSPPITQWGGQRPQKISRTRRTNLIPVSGHDEVPLQSEGCSSDIVPRISIGGVNASFLPKSAANGSQNFKVKSENVSSPARLSESEESGAGETRLNDKSSREIEEKSANAGQNAVLPAISMKKNKIVLKEENGDGVRRQGRSGRVSPYSRASISPTNEKLDNVVPSKPPRNARSGSDKTGSKSGRPLKKLSDRKGFSRLGHVANGGSPDCSGESDDDREELVEAAKLASCSNFNACSSAFWKTFDALFASVEQDDKSFLSEQLRLAEESLGSLSQICIKSNSADIKVDDNHHEEMAATNNVNLKDSLDQVGFLGQFQNAFLPRGLDEEKNAKTVPLYHRVLSALIIEDEINESEETGFGRQRSSGYGSLPLTGLESTRNDGLGYCDTVFGVQGLKNGNSQNVYPCNGNMGVDVSPSALDYRCNGELKQRDSGRMHPDLEIILQLSGSGYVPQSLPENNGDISSFGTQDEQLRLEEKLTLELQSIGLFVENVPALEDKEDGVSEEIVQLQRKLNEKMGKKKACLDKLYHGILEEDKIGRDCEQTAMDRLVELAYKKLLSTKGSYATKHGTPKVNRQVALSFVKRTLARCSKFEETGESSFPDPALRDILNAAPPRFPETDLLSDLNTLHPSAAKNWPSSNRGKKKEVLLDDVGGGSAFRASSALGTLGGAKGKRSERDRDRFPKAGRLSMGGSKGERKAKSKPKQKTAQLSTSGNTYLENLPEPNTAPANSTISKRKDVRFMSTANGPSAKESADFDNLQLDGIDEALVDPDGGAPQDLNSWFNFEVDPMQDHNIAGLDIPMDDLSELQMF